MATGTDIVLMEKNYKQTNEQSEIKNSSIIMINSSRLLYVFTKYVFKCFMLFIIYTLTGLFNNKMNLN